MDALPVEQETSPQGSYIAKKPAKWLRLFNRIFTRHMANSALLVLAVMLMAGNLHVPSGLLRDPDIWWHLADARILCTTHHFIRVEPYSFTVAGQPWVNPEWLGELPYWFSYRYFGLMGLYVVTGLILSANVLFVYWRGYWSSRHAGAAFWAAAIGFMLMTINGGARTIAIAYLLMSAELAILEAAERGKTRLLWLLAPLFCVWVNTHGSWIIGLGLLVLYVLSGLLSVDTGVFQQLPFSAEDRTRLLYVLGASVAALILNPYGWHLVWNPIDMMLNQKINIANVQEWQPLNLEWFAGKGAVLIIGLMVIANGMQSRKWKVYELAFVLFAWYAAFDHARFAFMAAILTVPMLAVDMERSFFLESDEKTIPVMNLLMVLGSACMIAYFFPTPAKLQKDLGTVFPLQSIASIQPSWRTLNGDGLGGMMDLQSKPTFVDSRFDTFEHHGVLKDFLDIMYLRDALKLLDKYQIDHVLLQKKLPLSYLLERTPGWTVVRTEGTGDETFDLLAKTGGADRGPANCAPSASITHH